METIREADYPGPRSSRTTGTIRDRFKDLEYKIGDLERKNIAAKVEKPFKFPFKWNWKFRQAKQKNKQEMALVLFFNKKNEIEQPMFVPIFSGNMIVYKNKAYEFDPRAIWRMRGVRSYPSVYCIREIDRRPIKNPDGTWKRFKGSKVYARDAAISNMDIDDVRARGDSTESDEFLIKAALKAQTTSIPIKGNWVIGIVVVIAIVGGLIWLMSSGAA